MIEILRDLLADGPPIRFNTNELINSEQATALANSQYRQWYQRRVLPILEQMSHTGQAGGVTGTIGDGSSGNAIGTNIDRGADARE